MDEVGRMAMPIFFEENNDRTKYFILYLHAFSKKEASLSSLYLNKYNCLKVQ